MKAAAYCRVSSVDQMAGGSLHHQETAVIAEADRRGWDLALIVSEQESTLKGQPARDRLLDSLDAGMYDALLVARQDRYARSLSDLLKTIERRDRHGWELVFVDNPAADSTTPQGRMMIHQLAVFGQFERDLIGLRTREGIAALKARGEYRGAQRPQSQPADAELVDVIMRAHHRGETHGQIIDLLELTGYPPPRAGEWSRKSVSHLVRKHCGTCERCVKLQARYGRRPVGLPPDDR